MTDREDALELIGQIYDAALDPERWPDTARRLAEFVGGAQPLVLPARVEPRQWLAAQLDPAQRERIQLLAPHLVRASEVMQRLRNAQTKKSGGLAALEELSAGVLVLDERGAVTYSNPAARRILAEDDGLKLRNGSRLVAADTRAQKALEAALADCLQPDIEPRDCSRGVRVPRRSKRPDYIVQIAALATRTDLRAIGTPGAAIVFISELDSEIAVDEALLRQLYGLTPAESRLGQLLLNGETISSAARYLGVGETTAKTQLQHIFQKTHTHRQPELVKLLLTISGSGLTNNG